MTYKINHENPFLPTEHPMLKMISDEVSLEEIQTKEFQDLLYEMKNLGKSEQKNKKTYVMTGLAAPQIGIAKRIILVDVEADGKGHVSKLRAYINPKITSFSKDSSTWYEGCYSLQGLTGVIERPNTVTVSALNENGEEIEETYSGYVGRIFQHEIDHLDGVLFVSHVETPKSLHHIRNPEDMYKYRNQQGWKNWEDYCTVEEFENLKNLTKKRD